jgi:hypothetical protein
LRALLTRAQQIAALSSALRLVLPEESRQQLMENCHISDVDALGLFQCYFTLCNHRFAMPS